MYTQDIQSAIVNYSVAHSGYDVHRSYIGLSGIGDCDQVIYDRTIAGKPASVNEHLKTRLSYDLEAVLLERLRQVYGGRLKPGREIYLHDGLVQGHTDGFIAGDLLEIKTVEREEWLPVDRRLPNRVFYQVQAYLHYLDIRHAHVMYLARDTGAIYTIGVTYSPSIGRRIDQKVERLVAAVRNLERPACSCGHCRMEGSE